jgi:hypothetical protein
MNRALALLSSLVIEDGRRWGDAAVDFQWGDAAAILDADDDDPVLHFATRPRGGSKTTDLAGIAAAALIEQLPSGGRSYAVASDRDQARLIVDALSGFVARTPGLASAIAVDRYAANTPAGARLEVVPADAASSYGLRGHLFIVDEITVWPSTNRPVWTSVLSAVPKVPGCRLVVLASAGDPAHWSFRIRERARTSSAWRLHEVPGPVPWVSAEALAEQRALLTDSQYRRLHLNRWTASEDRLVSAENLATAVRLEGPREYLPGVTYAIGVDLGLRHDRTAIAVCHAQEEGIGGGPRRIVLDRLLVFEGTPDHEVNLTDVEAVVFETWRRYGRPRVRMTPWQAISLAQRLRRRGVHIEEWSYSPQRYGSMASVLFGLLRDGLLDLYDAPGLVDEFANVRLKETLPGQLRVTHDPGHHDDMVVSIGMAALALIEKSHAFPMSLRAPRGRVPATNHDGRTEPGPPVLPPGQPRPDPSRGWRPGRRRTPLGYTPPRRQP